MALKHVGLFRAFSSENQTSASELQLKNVVRLLIIHNAATSWNICRVQPCASSIIMLRLFVKELQEQLYETTSEARTKL